MSNGTTAIAIHRGVSEYRSGAAEVSSGLYWNSSEVLAAVGTGRCLSAAIRRRISNPDTAFFRKHIDNVTIGPITTLQFDDQLAEGFGPQCGGLRRGGSSQKIDSLTVESLSDSLPFGVPIGGLRYFPRLRKELAARALRRFCRQWPQYILHRTLRVPIRVVISLPARPARAKLEPLRDLTHSSRNGGRESVGKHRRLTFVSGINFAEQLRESGTRSNRESVERRVNAAIDWKRQSFC